MRVTNNMNLPQPLVNACEPREKISFLTASQTATSPREYWLKERHWDMLSEDVADRLWSLYGTGVHSILEQNSAPGDIVEQRFETDTLPKSFSGMADRYVIAKKKLQDWKFTSVWSGIFGSLNASLEKQLNANAYLWVLEGYHIEELEGILLFRDWKKTESLQRNDYPDPVMRIQVPVWSQSDRKDYLSGVITILSMHENTPDDELPHCTPEQRWQQDTLYKVYKGQNKTAMRGGAKFTKQSDAMAFADAQACETRVECIPGKCNKCIGYCDVSSICSQWEQENQG